MDRCVGPAARLPENDRKDLAIQALAQSATVSDLAARHGVSRKFGRGSESAFFRLHETRGNCRPVRVGLRLERGWLREAVSLPGSSSLGLKRSQAQQGEPMRMALAGHQLSRAFAVAFGTSAAQEAAVVQEEPQQIQV